MTTGYITHDEAMIMDFMKNPDYADELLQTVIAEGDDYEIQRVQNWIDKAKIRSASTTYWERIPTHAQETALSGYGIKTAIAKLYEALNILKAALPTQANA